MKPHPPSTRHFEPPEEQIQHGAYYLWEELGRPAGRDLEIWLAAKELLRHRPGRPRSGSQPAPHAPRRRPRVQSPA